MLRMPLKVVHYAKLPPNPHGKVQCCYVAATKRAMGINSHRFLWPIPDGCHILVAKDQYSWFPVCEFVKSTSVHNTIPNLGKTFADYGNPKTVTSDNGPPNSQTFKDLATKEGFYHHWTSHNIHSPTLGNVS